MFVSSACMEAHTHTYSHTLTILGRGPDPQCPRKALDRVYNISSVYPTFTHIKGQCPKCLCVCVCVAKPVAVELCCHATALFLVIGKAQFR